MAAKKYALQPLVEVRRDKADVAKRELAGAIREREQKARELRAAHENGERHRVAAERVRDAERSALEGGALRAVDLLRQNAWELQQEREREELRLAAEQAEQRAEAARAGEQAARELTSTRLGELEAVERDRARFVQAAQNAALAAEEEAAEEAWRPRSR